MKVIAMCIALNTFNLSTIIHVLKQLESNNNTQAIGDGGKALGVLQIHKACVIDVNRYYKTSYKHKDAFSESASEDIFMKYLTIGIKYYNHKYKKQPTEEEVVRMWNGGCYSGYLYESTKSYYNKYKKIKSSCCVLE